jgi:hypothetical protein
VFQELKQKLLSGQMTFAEALPKALPQLRGKVSDEKLLWLASELQGYSNAIEFYQNNTHGLPRYRIVPGALFLMTADGNLNELKHPYARRTDYFLSAPVAWLEEFARLQGDISLVEVPELTAFMSGAGGGVVCQTKKVELRRIIANFRNEFIALLDQVEPTN